MRVGLGYDVHRLVHGRTLILGGVTIPYAKGLWGHSDADVLVHALCDALLGAAGLGDIGEHFPDSDPAFRNIDSTKLLRRVVELLSAKGYGVHNIDATIMAEAPKLAPYRPAIQRRLAQVVDLTPEQINIKATTMEGLGSVGRKQGMAAMCVVLIKRLK